jgi:hypothetical protein
VCCAQAAALLYYVASYIPYARKLLRQCAKGTVKKWGLL